MSEKVTQLQPKRRQSVSFWIAEPLKIDLQAARDQYNNPEVDYTDDERRKLLAIVDLVEAGRLTDAVDAVKALTGEEREYLMCDINALLVEHHRSMKTLFHAPPKGEAITPYRQR